MDLSDDDMPWLDIAIGKECFNIEYYHSPNIPGLLTNNINKINEFRYIKTIVVSIWDSWYIPRQLIDILSRLRPKHFKFKRFGYPNHISNSVFKDISGVLDIIKNMKLEKLYLAGIDIDLSLLEFQTDLTRLSLDFCRVDSFKPIDSFQKLTKLHLEYMECSRRCKPLKYAGFISLINVDDISEIAEQFPRVSYFGISTYGWSSTDIMSLLFLDCSPYIGSEYKFEPSHIHRFLFDFAAFNYFQLLKLFPRQIMFIIQKYIISQNISFIINKMMNKTYFKRNTQGNHEALIKTLGYFEQMSKYLSNYVARDSIDILKDTNPYGVVQLKRAW